jgi:hypothetical protein
VLRASATVTFPHPPRDHSAPTSATPLLSSQQRTNTSAPKTFVVAPARYVLLSLAEQITGYTVKAMQRKIERGDWVECKVWVRAPDRRVLIDMVGYHKWVEGPQ